MSIITSHELARFYELYRQSEVTFTKQVTEATGLQLQTVLLKVGGSQWPCVLYSCSMAGARTVVNLRNDFYETLQRAEGHLSLRLAFKRPDKQDPISFYVSGKSAGLAPYSPQNPLVQLLAIEFGSRPSDELIQILGVLLEANANSQRRREERIPLTPENLKRMGLESRDCTVAIQGASHRGILRDLSFSGAKVLTVVSPTLAGQPVAVKIARSEAAEEITLWGEVARVEQVQDHPDLGALGIKFLGEPPVTFKLMISGFLSGPRRTIPAPPPIVQQPPARPAPTARTTDAPAGHGRDGTPADEPPDQDAGG